jgi:CBS domain-containing protein
MKLGDLLNEKDSKYRARVTARPDETVEAVIKRLTEYDRGSMTVCEDDGTVAGIITERDIIRKCYRISKNIDKIKVQDIMTKKIIVGKPDDDLSYAINVMKEKRIRHLPMVDADNKFIGMISMRDLLGVQLDQCNIEVRFLNDFISGQS